MDLVSERQLGLKYTRTSVFTVVFEFLVGGAVKLGQTRLLVTLRKSFLRRSMDSWLWDGLLDIIRLEVSRLYWSFSDFCLIVLLSFWCLLVLVLVFSLSLQVVHGVFEDPIVCQVVEFEGRHFILQNLIALLKDNLAQLMHLGSTQTAVFVEDLVVKLLGFVKGVERGYFWLINSLIFAICSLIVTVIVLWA